MKRNSKIFVIFSIAAVIIFSLSFCYKEKIFLFDQRTPRVLGISDAHPRIWLNADKLSELQAKISASHSTWTNLKSWADSNLSTSYTSEFYALNTGELVNFAIVYKMTGDNTYARAAIDKMLYMWDHPYISTSVDSLDDWVTGNSWYTARYLVPSSAIIFDWCYEAMTEAERTRFISQLDTWASMIAVSPTPSWAWHDSSSNYWYGYMWALTTAGYALFGHSINATTYLDYVKNIMVPEALAQVNDQRLTWDISTGNFEYGRSKGGEWSEGNAYGIVNTEMLVATLFAIQNAEGINNFNSTSFFDEYITHTITNQPPGSLITIDAGDAYLDNVNGGKLKGPFTMAVAGAIAKNSNSTAARYGKYWLDLYLTSSSNSYKRFEDFIFYPMSTSALNFNQLNKDYFAEGMQIQNYRSSWSNEATWFYSRFNMHYSDHSNDGQGGHFSLWKNGWLIKDYAYTRYEGPPPNDAVHNLVYLPPDGDAENGMLWDQPDILHRLNTNDYLYYAADASDVFSGPEVRCDWRACNVLLNQRSFFYLKSNDNLLVYDRIKTENAGDEKAWQVYLENAPQISGNISSASNGNAKVFIKTLLPTNPSISAGTYAGEDRLQVKYPQAATENTFLHVIEAADGSPAAMSPASLVTATNSNLVGSFVNQQFIVLFSANNEIVSEAEYAVSASGAVTHFITGLAANTNYYFSGPTLCNHLTTNSEGVLSFTSSGSGKVDISTSSLNCQTVDLIPSPYASDDPTPATCEESWSCSSWLACEAGNKTRQCFDYNNCGTQSFKPVESVSCTGGQESAAQGQYLAVSPSWRAGPQVRIYNNNFLLHSQFFAYGKELRKGVNIALGDMDGDGETEIVTGPGPGAAAHVRIFNAAGQAENQFFAFPSSGRLGVNLATGDVDGDGQDEIIVAPAEKGGPHVRIFKYDSSAHKYRLLGQFFAFPTSLRMGLEIASGDLNNDGRAEILATPRGYGGPQVRIFSYAGGRFSLYSQFFAYAKSFRGGLNMAVGDADNDGVNEIITAAGPGGGPHVRIFNSVGQVENQFFAAATSFRGGLDVAAFDYNEDGGDEIITAPYSAGPPGIKTFIYNRPLSSFFEDKSLTVFSSLYREGIRVAGN
ncbi:MAG: FG-GAP-like repeat-containing protein [Patescibacteria group bacterium]